MEGARGKDGRQSQREGSKQNEKRLDYTECSVHTEIAPTPVEGNIQPLTRVMLCVSTCTC